MLKPVTDFFDLDETLKRAQTNHSRKVEMLRDLENTFPFDMLYSFTDDRNGIDAHIKPINGSLLRKQTVMVLQWLIENGWLSPSRQLGEGSGVVLTSSKKKEDDNGKYRETIFISNCHKMNCQIKETIQEVTCYEMICADNLSD